MVMSPVHQVWPKPSCKAQWKGEEDKADSGRGVKTTSGNGQAWSSLSPRGQWRTGKLEETGCEVICDAPTTLAVKGWMRWDRWPFWPETTRKQRRIELDSFLPCRIGVSFRVICSSCLRPSLVLIQSMLFFLLLFLKHWPHIFPLWLCRSRQNWYFVLSLPCVRLREFVNWSMILFQDPVIGTKLFANWWLHFCFRCSFESSYELRRKPVIPLHGRKCNRRR